VAEDPALGPKIPDLVGTLKRILDRLEKEPIAVSIMDRRTRQPVVVKLGKFAFQVILMMDLGDTNDLPVFPALIYTIDKGDYSILAQFVEKRFNQFGGGVSLMSFMMDASSGATRDRHEQILRESKEALLDNAMNFPFPEVGHALGNPDLGDTYRSPIVTDVPTLFISGELDNNTPPFQADEVRKSFKQSSHLVVENAGHESMLVEPAVQQAIVDFLLGKDVSGVKLAAPPLRFRPLPEPENRQD
jgi:pimeloyl-ACP methyl ester carboxylesterase